MIFSPERAQGISLTNFVVIGFEKGYNPSLSFEHTKFTVPDGFFDEIRETLHKLRNMQTTLANALDRPVKVEFRIDSELEAIELFRERK